MNFLLWNRKLNRDEWMENRRSVLASPILVEGGRRIRGWGEVLCGWFVDDTEDTQNFHYLGHSDIRRMICSIFVTLDA